MGATLLPMDTTYDYLLNHATNTDATMREHSQGVAVEIGQYRGPGEWPILETRVFTGDGCMQRAVAFAKRRIS